MFDAHAGKGKKRPGDPGGLMDHESIQLDITESRGTKVLQSLLRGRFVTEDAAKLKLLDAECRHGLNLLEPKWILFGKAKSFRLATKTVRKKDGKR